MHFGFLKGLYLSSQAAKKSRMLVIFFRKRKHLGLNGTAHRKTKFLKRLLGCQLLLYYRRKYFSTKNYQMFFKYCSLKCKKFCKNICFCFFKKIHKHSPLFGRLTRCSPLRPVETFPVKNFRCQLGPKLTNFYHSPF